MRIETLEIYGYGRLEQRKYSFDRPFTQIFGENETGKSTMQLFIHSILFGFPSDEDEPRLMPRFAERYGGSITFVLNEECIFVERVYQHQEEQITVRADGHLKDEAWLQQRLNFMTKNTYRQIFSFDVLGLQQVHRLTEEKLEAYLLEAGVFGSTEYSKLEIKLQDERELLLSEDAEEGIISDHLHILMQLEQQIRAEEERFYGYHTLVNEETQLEQKIAQLGHHIKQLSTIQQRKQKELMFHADMKEWKALEHALNIPPISFPAHGIERYETLKAQLEHLKEDKLMKESQLQQLADDRKTINRLDPSVDRKISELLQLEASLKENQQQLENVKKDRTELERKIKAMEADIGWQSTHDVSFDNVSKERTAFLVGEKERLTQQLDQLKREHEETEEAVTERSAQLQQVEKSIVSDEQFDNGVLLNERRKELVSKNELYDKMRVEQEQLARAESTRRKQLNTIYAVVAAAGVGAAAYLFYVGMYIAAGLLVILPILMIGLIFINKPVINSQLKTMTDELDLLNNKILKLSGSLDAQFDLSEQRGLREQKRVSLLDLSALQHKKERLSASSSKKEEALQAVLDEIAQIKKTLHLTESFEDNQLNHAYHTAAQLASLQKELDALNTRHTALEAPLSQFFSEIAHNQLAEGVNSLNEIYSVLNQRASNEKEEQQREKQLNDAYALSSKAYEAVTSRYNHTVKEISELFESAQADTENDYYDRFNAYNEYVDNLSRHAKLSSKLAEENFTYEANTELAYTSSEDLRLREAEVTDQLQQLKDEQAKLQFELGHIQEEKRQLEEDTTLSDLKHRFAIEQRIFNDRVDQYDGLSYIDRLIESHRQSVKKERIPHIIKEASNIFKTLTEARYTAVTYEEGLMVKHHDGQLYRPIELSQSTKELLYIAMRLSLIDHLRYLYPMPLIIDDAFVHFDRHRKNFILDYLMENEQNQVLYFTCNRSMNIIGKNTLVLERHEKEIK